MIRLFVSLRVRLTRNIFRTSAGFGLLFLIFFAGSVSLIATVMIHRAETDSLGVVGPLLSSGLILGWMIGPIIYGSSDETIDTSRLALYPIDARQVTKGILVSSFLSPVALAMFPPLIAFSLRAPTPATTVVSLLAGLATTVLALTGSRLVVTSIAAAFRTRGRRDWSTILTATSVAVLAISFQMATFFGISLEIDQLRGLSTVLRLTPFGWTGNSMAGAIEGSLFLPLAEIAAASTVAWWLMRAWTSTLELALTEVESSQETREFGGHLLRSSSSDRIMAPIVAKELRYLKRHPRYRVQAVSQGMVLLVGGAPIVRAVADKDPEAVLLGCIPALTVGIAGANLLAPDGGALWAEILATDSLKPILRGRSLAFAGFGVAGAALVTILTAIYTKGFLFILPALGAAVGFALVGSGVGTVISVVAPSRYPSSESPNPFASNSPGGGVFAAVLTFTGVIFGLVLVLPILAGLGYSRGSTAALAVTTIVSPAYGFVLWWLTTRFASKRADSRVPELIASVS